MTRIALCCSQFRRFCSRTRSCPRRDLIASSNPHHQLDASDFQVGSPCRWDARCRRDRGGRQPCGCGARGDAIVEREILAGALRRRQVRHQHGCRPGRTHVQRGLRLHDDVFGCPVRCHCHQRTYAEEPDVAPAFSLRLGWNKVGGALRLSMGLLPGRRGRQSMGARAVMGVLCTSGRRLAARHLAYRHCQRPVPRQRRHAGGGVSRSTSIERAGCDTTEVLADSLIA